MVKDVGYAISCFRMSIMCPCSFIQTGLACILSICANDNFFSSHCLFVQVYGVLDVQRVAGNFHISVHGLNIFVAQQVSSFTFVKYSFM